MTDPTSEGFAFPETMSLRLAAVYANISEQRLRILVRQGRIKSTQAENGLWMITRAELDAWNAHKPVADPLAKKGKGSQPRTSKAWVIRIPTAMFDEVSAYLTEKGITLENRYNYEKMKEYRIKRDAKLKAEGKKPAKKSKQAKSAVAVDETGLEQ